MSLYTLDFLIIFFFFILTLGIALIVGRKSGKNADEYFLSGRNMPWWLLGFSMVATTFSTDTPNLVTNIVRENGVSGNWIWWAFLLTGLLTVFVYARLWRKSDVHTDIEFYELRYGGYPAQFLRAFRALYLGFLFNVLAMGAVCLATIKIGGVMLGLSPWETIGIASVITVVFSVIGGFRGIVYTDVVLFITAMVGMVWAAYYCVNLPEVGGLQNLVSHSLVSDKLSIFPSFEDTNALITLFIIPLAVQWWSTWYPGAEPGGGGYVAQRMLAAKGENHAIRATLFFNIMHYAVRPWPWILIALASLIIFPDLESIRTSFPNISKDKLGHDLAYPAMLTLLPTGVVGLVLASLISAYMSTISTHLNWGSSYLVYDFYQRYIKKDASEKELVLVARISTVALMLFSAILAVNLEEALQIFEFIVLFGAGTGLILILRWFWWRINAWGEIAAMFTSGILSTILILTDLGAIMFGDKDPITEKAINGWFPDWMQYPFVVFTTTIVWLFVIYRTRPERKEVLYSFYRKIKPGGPGWKSILMQAKKDGINLETNEKQTWTVPFGILAILLGCGLVYGLLFATGYVLYGKYYLAVISFVISSLSLIGLTFLWKKIKTSVF